ncbi:MAG TPA: hypothetical protein VH088_06690 [Terriglobales bacterium]|jgi:hypothetical protein|nr:hypothetical protein [Terriglobales bacterium]
MRLFLLLFWTSFQALAFAQTSPAIDKHAIQVKMQEIGAQVDVGDYTGIAEAAHFPTPIAVRFTYGLYNRGSSIDDRRYKAVIAALRRVPGHADYLREDMARIAVNGDFSEKDYDILSLINSREAQAVIAPYLFDLRETPVVSGDSPFDRGDNCGEAVIALERMTIPDAPKRSLATSNSENLIAWQKWAMANDFVPANWISRVGAPEVWLKFERLEKAAPSRSRASTE